MTIDGGSSSTSNGVLEYQYLYYFMHNIMTSAPSSLYNLTASTKTKSFAIELKDYPSVASITRDTYYTTTLYLFTKRTNSYKVTLTQLNIYLKRSYSELVSVLDSYKLLDYYNNLILDASGSYDSEDTSDKSFYYRWICP